MKLKVFFYLFFLHSLLSAQSIDFNSPKNIKSFADYLFCDGDYLRSIDEYERYLAFGKNDTIEFKIALGYVNMDKYQDAIDNFSKINNTSLFYESAKIERLKAYFLNEEYSQLISESDSVIKSESKFAVSAFKLRNFTLLLNETLPSKENFLFPFNEKEKKIVLPFYEFKNNPPYKSEALAGILSTIIPGAGKIYTQNYSDGITAFILTGLFGYLAYTNFDHHHDFRAWTFTGLGALFYAGNIYGSIASAQIFNAKVNFEIDNGIKIYLENNNYFTPNYDFCK
jgi:tetratricopeptide (TPR) repeat protein